MKALVIEDDAKVARLLVRALVEDGYTVDTCDTAEEARKQAVRVAYDLLVLDWMLPDGDGLAVCRALRADGCATPVMMLTARGELSERVLGLEAGADDYLVKPFYVEEFLARVRALQRRAGGGYARLRCGDLEIDRLDRKVTIAGRALELTGKEYALLLHLAFRPERVVTRSELLEGVWATRFDPGSNTVEVHVSHVRDKLAEHAWMIETVRGRGYRLRTRIDPLGRPA